MPQRLRRYRSESSNEKLLEKYGNLAKYVVGKYARLFDFTREQTEDAVQSLLLAMFDAPPSYRNYKGISIIFKWRMRDFTEKKVIKHEPEIRMGLLRGGEGLAMIEQPHKLEPHLNGHGDLACALKHIDKLSSPERTVLAMTFGIDGLEEFDDFWIASSAKANLG